MRLNRRWVKRVGICALGLLAIAGFGDFVLNKNSNVSDTKYKISFNRNYHNNKPLLYNQNARKSFTTLPIKSYEEKEEVRENGFFDKLTLDDLLNAEIEMEIYGGEVYEGDKIEIKCVEGIERNNFDINEEIKLEDLRDEDNLKIDGWDTESYNPQDIFYKDWAG